MKVIWLSQTRRERKAQLDYIAFRNPAAAIDIGDKLIASVRTLRDFPEAGRRGSVTGTRELVVTNTPLIAIYRVFRDRSEIHILRILHSSQKWPPE
jgi:toxin ParE1/3/4